MPFLKTAGSVAVTCVLALSLLAGPAANAAAPIAATSVASASLTKVPLKAQSCPKAKTTKTAPKIAPAGYFAVAVYGSLRKDEVNHCRLFGFGKAYTNLPYRSKVTGDLKFSRSVNTQKYAFLKPGKNTTVVEIYYFPISEKRTVLARFDSFEAVSSKMYVRKSVSYGTAYVVTPRGPKYLPLMAETYFAGANYKNKAFFTGAECTVRGGDYTKRKKPGYGCA